MDTWYTYAPADNDAEDGSRLMLDWGLSYNKAITSARVAFHTTGKVTKIADEWHDTQILAPQMEKLGMTFVPNRRAADPRTSSGLWTNDAFARLAMDIGL